MARVKILATVYNPIAYDGRVQRECEALSKIADVELLCPHGPDVPEGLPFQVRTVRLPVGPGETIRRHLKFASALISRACRARPNVIHAHDYFMAAPGVLAAVVSRARLIYDAHELIIPEPRQPMSRRSRYWYLMESCAVKRAHLVVAASDERSRLMWEHYRLHAPPLVVRNIPPVPLDVSSVDANALRGPKGERLCVYQGDVSLKRGLSRLLEAVPFMPSGIRILIVGGGPDELAVRQEVGRLGIEERVTLLGRVPRDKLHGILRTCDVGLMFYPFEGLNNIYCAPNKIFEYAQAGLPIVTTGQPPLENILATYKVGVSFSRFEDPRSLAGKIVSVIEKRRSYRKGLNRLLAENTWAEEAERLRRAVSAIAVGR